MERAVPKSTKRKYAAKLALPVVKPAAGLPSRATIDESRTLVSSHPRPETRPRAHAVAPTVAEAIEISSDPSDPGDTDSDSDEEPHSDSEPTPAASAPLSDVTLPLPSSSGLESPPRPHSPASQPAISTTPATSQPNEPARPILVDVIPESSPPELAPRPSSSTVHSRSVTVSGTSGGASGSARPSMATVLAQALRSDDADLLESCLSCNDLAAVRATIERLDSRLSALLLSRLAARIHRRPGRAGTLMTWVAWTLVAHGGALAAMPDLVNRLASLQKVLDDRARGLTGLLALKGKLDLLDCQTRLRRQRQRRQLASDAHAHDNIIWVEGDDGDDVACPAADIDPDQAADPEDPTANGLTAALPARESDDDSASEGEESNSDWSGVSDHAADDDDDDETKQNDVKHDDVDDSEDPDANLDPSLPPSAKVRRLSSALWSRPLSSYLSFSWAKKG